MRVLNWSRLEEEVLNPLFGRRVIHGANMTVARIRLKKDAVVPTHSHANEQISMVESGSLRFNIDGEERVLEAGDVLLIPPNAPHKVEALEDSSVVDVFSPVRQDWIRGEDNYLRK